MTLSALEHLAEQRLAQAAARGEFNGLPGAGRPLALDDDRLVPPEQRAALRVLKNAGYVPAEVQDLNECRELTRQLQDPAESADLGRRQRLIARLQCLQVRLEAAGLAHSSVLAQYGPALRRRLGGMR